MAPAVSSRPGPREHAGGLDRRDLAVAGAVVGVAFLWRLVYLLHLRDSPYFLQEIMDAAIHDGWAKAIAAGDPWHSGVYFRAPLYPWFLGALYRLTGSDPFAVRLAQILLGSLSCGLVYALARERLGRVASGTAGTVAALYWVSVFYDAELLIPVLAVFLNLSTLWLLLRGARLSVRADFSPIAWALAGLPLGLSAITRPNVLLFVPVAGLWLFLGLPRARRWRHMWIFVAAVALPIAPVTLHNLRAGDLVLVSSQAGVNLWIGNNPDADGMHVYVPGLTLSTADIYQGTAELASRESGEELSPAGVSRWYAAKARAFFLESPGQALRLLGTKAIYFWTHVEILNNKHLYLLVDRYAPFLRWIPLGFWLVGPLGLAGIGAAAVTRDRRTLLLAGFVVAYWASVVPFFVNGRFRLPVVPVLCVLGAYAVVAALQAWRERERRRLAALAISLVLGIGLVAVTPGGSSIPEAVALERLGASLLLAGRQAEGLATLREAVDADPEAVRPRQTLARALSDAGRDAEARDAWLEAGRLVPDDAEAWRRAALLSIRVGDLEAAREPLERARAAAPNDPRLEPPSARLDLAAGDARGAWERLRELPPGVDVPADLWEPLTAGLVRAGAFADAGEAMRRWVDADATGVVSRVRLSLLRSTAADARLRDCTAARTLAVEAVELTRRNDVGALDALAAAHAECGDFQEAVSTASEAMRVARQRADVDAESRSRSRYELYRRGQPLRQRG